MATELIGYKPLKIRPRTDIDELSLRKEVWQKGLSVEWHRGAPCPCSRKLEYGNKQADTNEPDPDCSLCKGTGIYYYTSQDIYAVVLAQKDAPERFAHYGERAIGAARFTVLPEHIPGWLDKFVVKDSYIEYRELRTRRAATETMRYPIKSRSIIVGSSAENDHVTSTITADVVFCLRGKLDNTVSTTELVKDTHFTVNSSGQINWSIGDALATTASVQITVSSSSLSTGDGVAFTISKLAGGSGAETKVQAVGTGLGYPTNPSAKSFEIVAGDEATTGANVAAAINNAVTGVTASVLSTSASNSVIQVVHDTKTDYGNSSTVTELPADTGSAAISLSSGTFSGGSNPVPLVGEKYTIAYYVNPTYIVKSFPYSLRTSYVNTKSPSDPTRKELPVRADCWLEWLGD